MCPKPTQDDAMETVEVEENGRVVKRPDRPCQRRAPRWCGEKENEHKKLWKVIDVEKNFNFWQYAFTPRGVAEIQLYEDLGGSTIQLSTDKVPMKVQTWLAIISLALLPFITQLSRGLSVTTPKVS